MYFYSMFLSLISQTPHTLISFLFISFIGVIVFTRSPYGRLNAEPKHHVLSFHLYAVYSDIKTFYVIDGAKGSSFFWVRSRECLWELFSAVPGREQVLEITGRPFVRAAFQVDARGKTKYILIVSKLFDEPVNR